MIFFSENRRFMERNFGRRQSPVDERDYKLSSFINKKESIGVTSKNWRFFGLPLDQCETPHCCGFSMANFGINEPINTKYTNEDGHKFYYLCKIKDGEPRAENGSDIRTVAKVLVDNKIIEGYAFAKTIEEVKWWLLNKGCMIVGTDWYEGMTNLDSSNICLLTGKIEGGHAYLLTEYTENNLIGIQNSWGSGWGNNGKAYIKASDFEKLLTRWGGEALAAVEISHSVKVPTPDPNAKFNLIKFLIMLWSKMFGKEN
jgi:hypothetical protein